jgi:hypothetical protein
MACSGTAYHLIESTKYVRLLHILLLFCVYVYWSLSSITTLLSRFFSLLHSVVLVRKVMCWLIPTFDMNCRPWVWRHLELSTRTIYLDVLITYILSTRNCCLHILSSAHWPRELSTLMTSAVYCPHELSRSRLALPCAVLTHCRLSGCNQLRRLQTWLQTSFVMI